MLRGRTVQRNRAESERDALQKPLEQLRMENRIAQHALKSSRDVALLLRLSFLEPAKTRRWLVNAPVSDLIIFNPRPQFRAERGSDSVTTAWFIWRWDRKDGPTNIHYCCDWKSL